MNAPDNEAMAGRMATAHSWPQYGDRNTISNSVSASLDVNPLIGEDDTYDSMRPVYPGEVMVALIDAAQRVRRENMPGRGGPPCVADIGAGIGKMNELLTRDDFLAGAVESSKATHTQASLVEGVT